jgi:ribosomal protein S18 acetylase RimI-like enzyme
MQLRPATEADHDAVVHLANLAYRGGDGVKGWNVESEHLAGDRLNLDLLRADLAAAPDAHLLLYCETPDGPPLGTVWLEPEGGDSWHLGLLSVHPGYQDRKLGRSLLEAAEGFAREQGAARITMSVINVRDGLIAWYVRRGYQPNGQTKPYPYGDKRWGRPLRDDMEFVELEKAL